MMQALLSGAPPVDPDRLSALRLPILVLAGEQDGIVPPGAVSALAALLPGAELRWVARCGHQIMLERPEETSQAIRDVIAAVGRSADA